MKRSELLLTFVATGTVLCLGAVAAWTVLDAKGAALEPPVERARAPHAERATEPAPALEVPPAPPVSEPVAAQAAPSADADAAPAPARSDAAPPPRTLVAGRVRGSDGLPLSDVEVEVLAAGHLLALGLSAPDGTFSFELDLGHPQHVPSRGSDFFTGRGTQAQETERLLARLRGLGYDDLDLDALRAVQTHARGLAELQGGIRGTGSRPRAARVELEVRAHGPGLVPKGVRIELASGEERRGIELVLAEGGFVVGRVDPALAEVWLIDPFGAIQDATRADRAGRYLLGFRGAGVYHVFARGNGTGTAWRTELSLSPFAPAELEPLLLAGRGTIAGHVIYADGRAASGVTVEAHPLELVGAPPPDAPWNEAVARTLGELGFFRGKATSNARGSFRIDGLQPGRYRLTLPEVLHGTPAWIETSTVAPGANELVYDGARLQVDVVLADGEGPVEVRCALESEARSDASDRAQTRTIEGEAGRVAFDVVPGGCYRVEARGPGGARTVRTLFMVESEQTLALVLVPGRERVHDDRTGSEPQALLRVELHDLDAQEANQKRMRRGEPELPTAVRGLLFTLRDASGTSPAGLAARPADRGWLQVPPGTWRVELTGGDGFWIPAQGASGWSVTLSDGDVRTLSLSAREGGRIALEVEGPAELLAEPLRVRAVDASGRSRELARDAHGRLDPLAAGEVTLHVSTRSSEPAETAVRVVARETVDAKVTLRVKQDDG